MGEGDGAWAFLKLMTSFGMQNPDGSYSDVNQVVPIVADQARHVNTASKYIKKGKAIAVYGYYRSWEANGQTHHGFFVRKFTFAKANYGGDQSTPAMPQG